MIARRTLLQVGVIGGQTAWAGATGWAKARGGHRPRLAVVMLNGGVDGLSLAPPLHEPRYHDLRGALAIGKPLPFSSDFGLHPALPTLAKLARAGELRLAPAVASPTRTRSHALDGESTLSGMTTGDAARGGWLNRALAAFDPKGPLPAVALDSIASTAVAGSALFGAWSPGAPAIPDGLGDALRDLYAADPQLAAMLDVTGRVTRAAAPLADGLSGPPMAVRADVLGRLFAKDDGPVVGFLSGGGFDTHQDQGADRGPLADKLRELDLSIAALREGAGEAWAQTVVVVCTEFGRTAAVNGTRGTDHGVGSAALLIGGALKRGGLIGDWPTLSEAALHEGRDLRPTLDIRGLLKGVLAEHWRLDRAVLERTVFPDSGFAPALTGLV